MERAEGASFWRVDGEAESNARDAIEIDAEQVRWRIEAIGGREPVDVAAAEPAARRFMSRVLAERRRIAQRSVVRAVPKPAPRRRRAEPVMVECPGCGGDGELGCGCCGGDGWVSLAAAEDWTRGQP